MSDPHPVHAQGMPVAFIYNALTARVLVDVLDLAAYVEKLGLDTGDEFMTTLAAWLHEQHSRVLRDIADRRIEPPGKL